VPAGSAASYLSLPAAGIRGVPFSDRSCVSVVYNERGTNPTASPIMPDEVPNPNSQPPRRSRAVDGVIRAEKMMQIAFILPAAVLVGWLGGVALDKGLHTHWIYLLGIILGCVAGFIQIFRLVLGNARDSERNGE
jgi:ATP synthase protein I